MEVKNYREAFRCVRGFAFDVDGVLTNGTVHVSAQGELLRDANSRDAYALGVAVRAGYPVAIISGGNQMGLARCCAELGVVDIYQMVREKVDALMDFCAKRGVLPADILYMGDDIPDVAPMKLVGLPTCPQDAVAEVKAVARYISHLGGGQGCVREVIEQVMKVQGKWITELTQKL